METRWNVSSDAQIWESILRVEEKKKKKKGSNTRTRMKGVIQCLRVRRLLPLHLINPACRTEDDGSYSNMFKMFMWIPEGNECLLNHQAEGSKGWSWAGVKGAILNIKDTVIQISWNNYQVRPLSKWSIVVKSVVLFLWKWLQIKTTFSINPVISCNKIKGFYCLVLLKRINMPNCDFFPCLHSFHH